MSNINLLPWRQARPSARSKQFGIMFGLFPSGTAVIALPSTGWCNSRSAIQQSAIQRLLQRDGHARHPAPAKSGCSGERRKDLIDRMQLIEQLQMRRKHARCVCSTSCPCWCLMGIVSATPRPAEQQDRCRRQDRSPRRQGGQHDESASTGRAGWRSPSSALHLLRR